MSDAPRVCGSLDLWSSSSSSSSPDMIEDKISKDPSCCNSAGRMTLHIASHAFWINVLNDSKLSKNISRCFTTFHIIYYSSSNTTHLIPTLTMTAHIPILERSYKISIFWWCEHIRFVATRHKLATRRKSAALVSFRPLFREDISLRQLVSAPRIVRGYESFTLKYKTQQHQITSVVICKSSSSCNSSGKTTRGNILPVNSTN